MRFITIYYGVKQWAHQNHIKVSTQKQTIMQSMIQITVKLSMFTSLVLPTTEGQISGKVLGTKG